MECTIRVAIKHSGLDTSKLYSSLKKWVMSVVACQSQVGQGHLLCERGNSRDARVFFASRYETSQVFFQSTVNRGVSEARCTVLYVKQETVASVAFGLGLGCWP